MSLSSAAVGPVDVAQFLADVQSGKIQKPTRSINVYLDPETVRRYNDLVAELDILQDQEDAGDPAGGDVLANQPASAALARAEQLAREIDELAATAQRYITFTFRAYEAGDQQAVARKLSELPDVADQSMADAAAILGILQFAIEPDPPLTFDQLKQLMPIIGYAQWNALCATYMAHTFGQVDAPKSPKPSRTRATGKR